MSETTTRDYWHQLVLDCTPGPYEGQPDWTPYYWHHMMDGEGMQVFPHDADTASYTEFAVGGTVGGLADVALFPELAGAIAVRLYVTDHGYARTEVIR